MALFKKDSSISSIFKKKNTFQRFFDRNRQIIEYTFVSIICTLLFYLIFYIVDKITNGNYLLANFLSYTISFSLLYYLDIKVFDSFLISKRKRAKRFFNFLLVRLIGFPIDSLLLSFLIRNFSMTNMEAKILGSLIMFIYNYYTNKIFVFEKNKLL